MYFLGGIIMNTEIKKVMKEIAERFMGEINGTYDTIDFDDRTYITIETLQEEYEKYKELEKQIDDYIEENDLDDVIDSEKIMNHFNLNWNYWFMSDQARLASFNKIIIYKIENNDIKRGVFND